MEDKWKTRSTSVWCPSFLLLSFYLVHQNRELSKELKRKQLKTQESEEHFRFQKLSNFSNLLIVFGNNLIPPCLRLLVILSFISRNSNTMKRRAAQQQEENYLAWSSPLHLRLQEYLESRTQQRCLRTKFMYEARVG
jgi:hypothetical protein